MAGGLAFAGGAAATAGASTGSSVFLGAGPLRRGAGCIVLWATGLNEDGYSQIDLYTIKTVVHRLRSGVRDPYARHKCPGMRWRTLRGIGWFSRSSSALSQSPAHSWAFVWCVRTTYATAQACVRPYGAPSFYCVGNHGLSKDRPEMAKFLRQRLLGYRERSHSAGVGSCGGKAA